MSGSETCQKPTAPGRGHPRDHPARLHPRLAQGQGREQAALWGLTWPREQSAAPRAVGRTGKLVQTPGGRVQPHSCSPCWRNGAAHWLPTPTAAGLTGNQVGCWWRAVRLANTRLPESHLRPCFRKFKSSSTECSHQADLCWVRWDGDELARSLWFPRCIRSAESPIWLSWNSLFQKIENMLCFLKGNVKISQISYKMIKVNSVPCRFRAFKINQMGIWQNVVQWICKEAEWQVMWHLLLALVKCRHCLF